ncbi:hypothetical protein CBF34_06830 [Vagococcus penaei]|uniref:Uncharacterized protein n=1 Tax=Vagococcus penaei TaxID=633807 RepID=A0A1Q2D3C6_9ENTE|nr:GNAT family N-acetyltransferase [Vagococcus penaei]AQP52879.1 hypothetical protein BW732_00665 [Vagococcus penaei]RSU01368.1 hypothetical protein CBF34_06830 [Vagococcus penaei]
MKIRPVTQLTNTHWQLLLEADPSEMKIKNYLSDSLIYECLDKEICVGLIVGLLKQNNGLEIMNLSVSPRFENQGIATRLIETLEKFAIDYDVSELYIATGTTSLKQLYLYQKCGFRFDRIDTNFFVDNYPDKIIENKLILKDRILLKKTLHVSRD